MKYYISFIIFLNKCYCQNSEKEKTQPKIIETDVIDTETLMVNKPKTSFGGLEIGSIIATSLCVLIFVAIIIYLTKTIIT